MRLQYLAKEERDVVGVEQQELAAIKLELQRLSQMTQGSGSCDQALHQQPTLGSDGQRRHTTGLQEVRSEVMRLTQERQSLLNARIYTPDDPVIRQLDAKIARLMAAATAA
jgi:hypothetical protein